MVLIIVMIIWFIFILGWGVMRKFCFLWYSVCSMDWRKWYIIWSWLFVRFNWDKM